MNKICTSIEQSKKLIELGIDMNTADMMWTYDFTAGVINGINVISGHFKPEEKDIPAWSISALFELLPEDFLLYKGDDDGCYYECYEYGNSKEFGSEAYSNVLDGVYEVICKLLETKRL